MKRILAILAVLAIAFSVITGIFFMQKSALEKEAETLAQKVAVLKEEALSVKDQASRAADEAAAAQASAKAAEEAAILRAQQAAAAEAAAVPLAEEIPAEADAVLAIFNAEEILQSEVKDTIASMISYGSLEDETDFRSAVDYLINSRIIKGKITQMGFDVFNDQEIAAFSNEADVEWEKALDDYVTNNLSEDTEEERASFRAAAPEYYSQYSFTKDTLVENLKYSAAYDRMNDFLLGDYTPDEEDILATFNEYGASYQSYYEGNVPMYEYMTNYYGYSSWYIPEGYRGIIHILLKPDDELLSTYSNLQATYEENSDNAEAASQEGNEVTADTSAVPTVEATATTVPETTSEPVTLEQVEAVKAAVIASKQDVIDQIYARLAAGETFQTLITEYGDDPGMEDDTAVAEGYSVHKDSILWDPAFTASAFSDKMQKVGDVSDPVVGSFGIHILYYLRDIPGGLIMTDDIHKEIYDYLYSNKANEAYQTALASWKPEFTIIYYDEAITAATEAAAAEADEEVVIAD